MWPTQQFEFKTPALASSLSQTVKYVTTQSAVACFEAIVANADKTAEMLVCDQQYRNLRLSI